MPDHLRTVRAITNAIGLTINQTIYDSFGRVLAEINAQLGDRFKFTGRELNSGNDYYYRARTYNASQARFTSLDPIRFDSSDANLYRYVSNNSLVGVDPSGLKVSQAALFFRLAASVAIGFTTFQLCEAVNDALDARGLLNPPKNAGHTLSCAVLGVFASGGSLIPVSYTHLTLPTILLV